VTAVTAPPSSPFKGLAAFADSELDALLFFGRERERDVIVANMLAARLTVLYGESGVGKSSLLAAAVVPGLREDAGGGPVALRDTWSGELEHLPSQFERDEEGYLVLDQFEEYFLYHGDELLHDLPELLMSTRVNVLIALREDSLARLDAFKAAIPGVFANQLRLEHLDVEQARRAILGPLARWTELTGERVDAEPALVEAVIDDVAVGGGHVEAPYLQLVLERVWEAERQAGSRSMRRATLERLGGAASIVRDQFRGALEALPADEQDVAAAMLEHLVTPTGTKIAHRAVDLSQYAGVDEPTLRRVLDRLTRERIVHSVDGSDRYEIFHDVLAEPVSAWRLERRLVAERAAAQRRQRRLYAVFGIALVALLIVAGLAVWALQERGTAERQAHHARARELEATALQQLNIDPRHSVVLALAAAKLEPSRNAEDVLRQAIFADRLRFARREPAPVTGVAVSPSGRVIAAAVPGVGVRLRDAATGRFLRTLPAHAAAAVGFSADGRQVVAAAVNGSATRWDARTGRPIASSQRLVAAKLPFGGFVLVPARGALLRALPHAEHVVAVRGASLIAASITYADGRKRPWVFARDGRRLNVLSTIGIHDLAFSPDGRLLAAARPDVTVLWDTKTWRRVHALQDAKQSADAIAFSPDGKFLATGGADSGVRIWDVKTGVRTFFLFAHTNPVTSMAWTPDSTVLATGSADQTVRIWRIQTTVGSGSLAATLPGDTSTVSALAFTPDGTDLVSGSLDSSVRLWLATPDEQLRLLGSAPGEAIGARWAGNTIAAAWSSGVVKLWDAQTRQRTQVFTSGGIGYTQLALSRDGTTLAVGRNDGGVDVWRNDASAPAVTPLPSRVTSVALTSRGDSAAAADAQGEVEVWSPRTGAVRWRGSPQATASALAFSPDGNVLAVSGGDGTMLVSAANGRPVHPLASPKGDGRATFSPSGRYVATAGLDGDARLWFARTGHLYRVLKGHVGVVNDVVFSRNSRSLATSGSDADVRIWNVGTGIGRAMQRRAFGNVPDVDFDSSGAWVVAAAPISAVVWQTSTGQQLFYLRGHKPLLTSASFAPNRPTVLTSSRDGTVRTYDCEICVGLPALVALAQERIAAGR
jgi:WD40 repeat protein